VSVRDHRGFLRKKGSSGEVDSVFVSGGKRFEPEEAPISAGVYVILDAMHRTIGTVSAFLILVMRGGKHLKKNTYRFGGAGSKIRKKS